MPALQDPIFMTQEFAVFQKDVANAIGKGDEQFFRSPDALPIVEKTMCTQWGKVDLSSKESGEQETRALETKEAHGTKRQALAILLEIMKAHGQWRNFALENHPCVEIIPVLHLNRGICSKGWLSNTHNV